MATGLGKILLEKGVRIDKIYNHQEASAKSLAELLNCCYTTNKADIPNDSTLYLIALKDDHILQTIQDMSLENKLVIHTSGSFSSQLLQQHTTRWGCFYPMQTIIKDQDVDLRKSPTFIEAANEKDTLLLEKIGKLLNSTVYKLDSSKRIKLHLAAVATNNFTYHLFSCIQDYCNKHQLPYSTLKPLLIRTIENINKEYPFKLQTGPAKRKDIKIIETHLNLLQDEEFLLDIYRLLSNQILKKHQDHEL